MKIPLANVLLLSPRFLSARLKLYCRQSVGLFHCKFKCFQLISSEKGQQGCRGVSFVSLKATEDCQYSKREHRVCPHVKAPLCSSICLRLS